MARKMTEQERQILRSLGPADKIRLLQSLYETAIQLKAAGFRLQHPEWSEQEIECAIHNLYLNART